VMRSSSPPMAQRRAELGVTGDRIEPAAQAGLGGGAQRRRPVTEVAACDSLGHQWTGSTAGSARLAALRAKAPCRASPSRSGPPAGGSPRSWRRVRRTPIVRGCRRDRGRPPASSLGSDARRSPSTRSPRPPNGSWSARASAR
jgi:hypothetical protein